MALLTLAGLTEQAPNPLPLRNSSWAFLGRVLRPFEDLAEADLVLGRVPVHRNGEFGHGAGNRGADIIFAELRHGDRDGLVKASGSEEGVIPSTSTPLRNH